MPVTELAPQGVKPLRSVSIAPNVDLSTFTLPTEKTKARDNLSDYLLFFYGEKKIGKTTLANMFPNSLHLFFEPGGKGLEAYAIEIQVWEQFQKVIDLLCSDSAEAKRFDNVIIDTADVSYD